MATIEELTLNGLDGSTGEYAGAGITARAIADRLLGRTTELLEVERVPRVRSLTELGMDPTNLATCGWGVIFANDADPALRAALKPLLERRRQQAGDLYREFWGDAGHQSRESKLEFLTRHGVGPGPVRPAAVPYYLLIVGDPERIGYGFQYQLDVSYAVGRLCLPSPDDYARYAETVLQAENGTVRRGRSAVLFGVRNAGDRATQLSADHLVTPLEAILRAHGSGAEIATLKGEAATKAALASVLEGDGRPALLFTASHGMVFPPGDPHQIPHQGALVCQDWPGPLQFRGAIPETFYFSGDDLSAHADVAGLIAFHFACYGAGTPRFDEFTSATDRRKEVAPRAFVGHLPRRLLGHPRGGALAVIGHVERAWGFSFWWGRAKEQIGAFEHCLTMILAGVPVGHAMQPFGHRYAELATDVNDLKENLQPGVASDEAELAALWIAQNDAKNYAVFGDPAVRLAAG